MPSEPDLQCFYAAAAGQMGPFTAAQARKCGFSTSLVVYHHGGYGARASVRRSSTRYWNVSRMTSVTFRHQPILVLVDSGFASHLADEDRRDRAIALKLALRMIVLDAPAVA